MKFDQAIVVHEAVSNMTFTQSYKAIRVTFGGRVTDVIRPSELQEEYRVLTGDEIQAYAERWIKDNLELEK